MWGMESERLKFIYFYRVSSISSTVKFMLPIDLSTQDKKLTLKALHEL
jgi:hypothetical protein